ncbi:MAG: DUF4277 domain-containing protein, partial [Desulfosalsimonadaceae bacterium]
MDNIESKAKMLDVKPLITHYMDQLSLRQLLEKYIPKTPQMQVAPADALSMLVFNIINAPNPLYKVSEWATDYLDGIGEKPQEAEKYNDDCLGRNLDRLYECNRGELMIELAANAINAHHLETDKIHNDSTTITFKGCYEHQDAGAAQLRHGHNKDFRPDCRQLAYSVQDNRKPSKQHSFYTFEAGPTEKGYRLLRVLSTAKAEQDQKNRERRLDKAETDLAELAGKLNRYKLKTRKQIEAAVARVTKN